MADGSEARNAACAEYCRDRASDSSQCNGREHNGNAEHDTPALAENGEILTRSIGV
jgi:hypothetical protein